MGRKFPASACLKICARTVDSIIVVNLILRFFTILNSTITRARKSGRLFFLSSVFFGKREERKPSRSPLTARPAGRIGLQRSCKNLQASNLHMSHLHGMCHIDFGAACSIWEMRTEICLGQNVHRSLWGAYSNLFRAGAASFRSTRGIQGHQHKQIYSIVCINEISVQMSKFVPCRSALLARKRAHMRDVVRAHCR